MRNVVTTDEISHLWAHQTQESARATSAMSFHGPNFKSYNEVIAGIAINRTGQKAFLVTAHTFSVTTSRHLSNVRESIPYGAKVFFVDKPEVSTREYVPVPDGKKYDAKKHGWMDKKDGHTANHAENLDYWRRRITRLLVEAGEARREVKRTRLMGEAAADLATMHEYVDFFGVKGVKYPVVASTPEELSEVHCKENEGRRSRSEEGGEGKTRSGGGASFAIR